LKIGLRNGVFFYWPSSSGLGGRYDSIKSMETPQTSFTFRRSTPEDNTSTGDGPAWRRWTFATPFVFFAGLTLPSLAVLVYIKQVPQLDALDFMGYIPLIKAVYWLLVPLVVLFGLLYLIRGKGGRLSKLVALFLLALVVTAFSFFNAPSR
jgi:hypothetical protein